MKALIEYLAKALVDQPEAVRVEEKTTEHSLVLELKVSPEDLGRIIGKNGRTVKAIRQLLSTAAAKSKQKVSLSVQE